MSMDTPVAVSYSGGASSEWIVEAIHRGVLPTPPHYAVFFADTGAEHSWTYTAVDEVEARCRARGVTFIRARAPGESLFDHVINSISERRSRMSTPPLWTKNQGGGRGRLAQKCTREWKTRPLRRAQSAWLKSIGKPKRITSWIGFSVDERHRASKALAKRDVKWEALDFPALHARRTRQQQRDEVLAWTGRCPQFSMCTFCPFKSPARWRATTGADLEQAHALEAAIARIPDTMRIDEECFLSDHLVTINEAKMILDDDSQQELFGPGCDGGRCFL